MRLADRELASPQRRRRIIRNWQSHDTAFDRNKIANDIATLLDLACAVAAVGVLSLILGYVSSAAFRDQRRIFHRTPTSVWRSRWRRRTRYRGHAAMLAVAALIGLPIGVGTAIYLSEYGHGWLARPSAS